MGRKRGGTALLQPGEARTAHPQGFAHTRGEWRHKWGRCPLCEQAGACWSPTNYLGPSLDLTAPGREKAGWVKGKHRRANLRNWSFRWGAVGRETLSLPLASCVTLTSLNLPFCICKMGLPARACWWQGFSSCKRGTQPRPSLGLVGFWNP